jgi:hypothetical protein
LLNSVQRLWASLMTYLCNSLRDINSVLQAREVTVKEVRLVGNFHFLYICSYSISHGTVTLCEGISKSSWAELTKCMLAFLFYWVLPSSEWSFSEFMHLVQCFHHCPMSKAPLQLTLVVVCRPVSGCFWRSLMPWKQCCQL